MAQVWGVCSMGMSENGKSKNGEKGAIPEFASQSQLHYLQLNVRLPPTPCRAPVRLLLAGAASLVTRSNVKSDLYAF